MRVPPQTCLVVLLAVAAHQCAQAFVPHFAATKGVASVFAPSGPSSHDGFSAAAGKDHRRKGWTVLMTPPAASAKVSLGEGGVEGRLFLCGQWRDDTSTVI